MPQFCRFLIEIFFVMVHLRCLPSSENENIDKLRALFYYFSWNHVTLYSKLPVSPVIHLIWCSFLLVFCPLKDVVQKDFALINYTPMTDKRYDVDDVGFYVSGIQAVQANHTYLYRNKIWLPKFIISTSSPAEGIQSILHNLFEQCILFMFWNSQMPKSGVLMNEFTKFLFITFT